MFKLDGAAHPCSPPHGVYKPAEPLRRASTRLRPAATPFFVQVCQPGPTETLDMFTVTPRSILRVCLGGCRDS